MNRLVVVIALAACGEAREPAGRIEAKPPAPAPGASVVERAFGHDVWSVLQREDDGDLGFVRTRSRSVPPGSAGAYVHLLRVRCANQAAGDPASTAAWLDETAALEDRMVAAWEAPRLALLAGVLTRAASREWLFYGADPAACQARLPDLALPASCSIAVTTDATWRALYEEWLGGQTAGLEPWPR